MRKFLAILLISAIYVALFSIVGIAEQNIGDVQVTLKSKNLGRDPAWGGDRATITITTNKIGNLIYVEEYYGTGSDGQPKFYQGGRYETAMNDYTVTFDMNRPNSKQKQYWSTIKSKVMLDKVLVYEVWINTSGTYKSFTGRTAWANNSAIDIGKGRPAIQKREPFNPTGEVTATIQTNNTENTTNNDTAVIVPEKSPMLEMPVVIATILFAIYIFSTKKNRK